MVVSMLQFVIELPEMTSIKEKRRIVKSIKDRLHHKFHLSISEVDLHDSLSFSQIGAAVVSNSKQFGESVLQKAIRFVENEGSGRLHDYSIHTEFF